MRGAGGVLDAAGFDRVDGGTPGKLGSHQARGFGIERGGDGAALGDKEKFAAAGVGFQLAGHQAIDVVAGDEHVLGHVLQVDRGENGVVEVAAAHQKTGCLLRETGRGRADILCGEGHSADGGDDLAGRIGDQKDGVLNGQLLPEFVGGIADGGGVLRAEGGAHVGHLA